MTLNEAKHIIYKQGYELIKEEKKLNEGRFAELESSVDDYIKHVKKYDAPVSIDDLISFVHDDLGIDYNVLYKIEDELQNILNEKL